MLRRAAVVSLLALAMALAGACSSSEPSQDTYFDRAISPTLASGCARSPTGSGCHVSDARGNAFGNLDVTSFARVDKRRDLLQTYGPYNQPAMLLKVIPNFDVELRAYDGKSTKITTDVRHTAGSILDPAGTAFQKLRRWMDNGATANNTGKPPSAYSSLPCMGRAPSSSHDLGVDPPKGDFGKFKDDVLPMLQSRCGAGNCHGAATNEFQLACGSAPEELRANYWAAVDYLAQVPEQSELVRRPLSPSSGGAYHGGGVIFTTPSDADYKKLLDWAKEHGPPETGDLGAGFDFFAHRVQPVLVRKGCMQLQCHSSSIFHDYRLRGGASGSFSLSTTRTNYNLSVAQLALETDDATVSRLVRKNLFRPESAPGATGIVHRGGALFEDFGQPATNASCDAGTYDYDNGDLNAIPAMCVIREWLKRERAARPLKPLAGIVYVSRSLPDAGARLLDFEKYAPGSDLRITDVTVGAGGQLVVGGDRSVLSGCGLTQATADVKRPRVSWNGSKIAFAARSSAGEGLRVYEMNADGSGCGPIADIGAHPASENGILIHDFDPAYSPPLSGGGAALVFASTRGNIVSGVADYMGPTRSTADPARANSNLYIWEADPKNPGAKRIRQLTYMLNMERGPDFMGDGRLVFTVEKRLPGFSQISTKRQNLDGGDYHPLYGNRGSLGYRRVQDPIHLADKNFAAIFGHLDATHGGGALGVFNRSIGVDIGSNDARDYAADPSVIDPASLSSPDPAFFLHSLRFPGGPSGGIFASPARMPDGKILVSWGVGSDASFNGDYDVYAVDAISGARTRLVGAAGRADVEAAAIYARTPRKVYKSKSGEPNAYGVDESTLAVDITMHDVATNFSIMVQNTPFGRAREDDLKYFEVWEELPPTPEVTTMEQGGAFVAKDQYGSVYVRRRKLGTVPIEPDGSARFQVTGGIPLLVELGPSKIAQERNLPRFVNEHFMFSPGESLHQMFPVAQFDSFCAGCHGSLSGKPFDVALQPDIMSRASETVSYGQKPMSLHKPPAERGPIVGP